MKARGMTLIELLVALTVAALVTAVVLTGSSALATQYRRSLGVIRDGMRPGDALAAILADIRRDPGWLACLPSHGCPVYVGSEHGMAIVANGHAWAIHDRGLRSCSPERCELVMAGVSALQVFVDTREGEVLRRAEASHAAARRAHRVEIRLWLADGSMRSRSAWVRR